MGETIQTVGPLAGICGHDGTDWIKALIDAGGRLQVDVVDSGGADLKDVLDELTSILTELTAKLETADLDLDASGRLSENAHGYIDGAWQKLPMVWGYSDTVEENVANTDTAAGQVDLDFTACPAGETHFLTSIFAVNVNTSVTSLTIMKVEDGTLYLIKRVPTPGINTSVESTNPVVVGPGQFIRCRFVGCALHDIIRATVVGYRMDTDL